MRPLRFLFFVALVLLVNVETNAQDYKNLPGHTFSKEDQIDFLLFEIKKQKTKAIGALVLGSALTGTGVYLMNKDPYELSGAGGYYSLRESKNLVIGKIICAAGIGTALASIPLFISAGKARKELKLLMKDETTSFLYRRIAVPSFCLQVQL